MEMLIKLIAMLIIILPFVLYVNYLFKHINKKTKFDYHLSKVKDKKGIFGIVICYANRIVFGITSVFIGMNILSNFEYDNFTKIMIISVVIYIITKYIDSNNEK